MHAALLHQSFMWPRRIVEDRLTIRWVNQLLLLQSCPVAIRVDAASCPSLSCLSLIKETGGAWTVSPCFEFYNKRGTVPRHRSWFTWS
ncbi:hypothetical protein BaRGS_00038012 [Batillaria attramentaria]|uniref:Uncharacterized protein n=1 Tax=Batillaria attramentaria TaxID=370345 RepID=A0ABD0J754_9CAEN